MDKQSRDRWATLVLIEAIAILALIMALRASQNGVSAQEEDTNTGLAISSEQTEAAETEKQDYIHSPEKPEIELLRVATVDMTALAVETEPAEDYQSAEDVQETDAVEISETDEVILLKIAMAEAESEGVQGKALVMLTVLNRVNDERFPDTVEGVVFQKNQFSVTVSGGRYYTTEPDEECSEALELVESGWDESCGALYFESGSGWHSANLTFLFQYGNHKFYL